MIYKIRVILDAKESIFRDIEIKDKQTLWNLHLGIKSAFSLPGDELSSFYFSDDEWAEGNAVPLEDMSDDGDGETMSDVYLNEGFPKVGSKMRFQYGFLDLWEFFCELMEISDEKPSVNYPITVFRFGNVPLKAPTRGGSAGGKAAGIAAGAAGLSLLDDDFNDLDDDLDTNFTGDAFDDEEDNFDDEEEGEFFDDKLDEEDDDL